MCLWNVYVVSINSGVTVWQSEEEIDSMIPTAVFRDCDFDIGSTFQEGKV